jgi:hypothetical protein
VTGAFIGGEACDHHGAAILVEGNDEVAHTESVDDEGKCER